MSNDKLFIGLGLIIIWLWLCTRSYLRVLTDEVKEEMKKHERA